MPIDVTQLNAPLKALAERARDDREARDETIVRLRAAFGPRRDNDELLAKCLLASRTEQAHWSGALFDVGEPLHRFFAFGVEPNDYVLIAVDGSQIMPDRHKPIPYYAIQVGTSCTAYGFAASRSAALQAALDAAESTWFELVHEQSKLFDEDGELVTPGEISNERDLRELEWLAEKCAAFSGCGARVVALTDGQIVPFSLLGERASPARRRATLTRFTAALDVIRDSGAQLAGYVDRPNSNALARTCDLADAPLGSIGVERLRQQGGLLRGVFDRHVLENFLPSAQRTALFTPAWRVNDDLGPHLMRACYANVAPPGERAVIARIEAPDWCADDAAIGLVCAVLQRHADMGAGYPLILKAAHEAALVGKGDQKEIDDLVQQALVEAGEFAAPSLKQQAKDLA